MRIEFEVADLDDKDAAALVALILVSRPKAMTALQAFIDSTDLDRAVRVEVAGSDPNLGLSEPAAVFGSAPIADANPPMASVAPPAAPANPIAASATPAPAASPAPAAVSSPPTSAPASQAGVDYDSEGFPYDNRIHSDPPKKTDKGVWRKRRSLGAGVEATIKAELIAQGRTVSPGSAPSAQPAAQASAPASPAPAAAPPASPPVPAATAEAPASAPVATAPAPVPPVAETSTDNSPTARFGVIMTKATNAQNNGKLAQETFAQIAPMVGLTSAADLLTNPAQMDAFEAILDATIAQAG